MYFVLGMETEAAAGRARRSASAGSRFVAAAAAAAAAAACATGWALRAPREPPRSLLEVSAAEVVSSWRLPPLAPCVIRRGAGDPNAALRRSLSREVGRGAWGRGFPS